MADTKELTENEKRALEEYATTPGWYQYPGVDKALRKNELLDLLDGDEFSEEDTGDDLTAGIMVEVPKLVHGQRSFAVLVVRVLLQQLAYATNRSDTFNGELERAVMEFQSDERIPVTGEVDAATWQALLRTDRPIV